MKMNKKLLIPVLSTVMGLSVIGGISGSIAWYQYNSKVSASFIGTSVADTGVLQIGHKVLEDHDNNPQTPKIEVMKWERDFSLLGEKAKLIPVTFGAMNNELELLYDDEHNPLDENGDSEQDYVVHRNILPSKAYAYPEAGAPEGYEPKGTLPGWVEAEKGKHYAQFDIYLRAYQADSSVEEGFKLVERDVYLSDVILKSVENNKVAEDALRVHLNVDGQENLLLSKNEYKDDTATADENEALALFGGLDLDKNGHNDKYHATLFNDNLKAYGKFPDDYHDVDKRGQYPAEGQEIVYGKYGDYQETKALLEAGKSIINERDAETGKMPEAAEKKILTTKSTGEVKVTVTVWLEGWEALKTGDVIDPDTHDVIGETKAREWNPYFSAGTDVQLGLQFDTGVFRGNDLN